MQVTLDKQYPVAAEADAAWAVLSDIHALATCMPGAQITEQLDATHYKGSVKVKVGPANAAFAGDIEVLQIDAVARTLRMIGKGADKSGSSASMELTATLQAAGAGATTLVGRAEVIVNGKFAQFGSRMLMPVSDVLLAQFAQTFSAKALALQGGSAGAVAGAGGAVPVPQGPKELNALTLLWTLVRNFFTQLFGRRA